MSYTYILTLGWCKESIEDEKEAEKLGLELVSYLYKDYIEYQKGIEEGDFFTIKFPAFSP